MQARFLTHRYCLFNSKALSGEGGNWAHGLTFNRACYFVSVNLRNDLVADELSEAANGAPSWVEFELQAFPIFNQWLFSHSKTILVVIADTANGLTMFQLNVFILEIVCVANSGGSKMFLSNPCRKFIQIKWKRKIFSPVILHDVSCFHRHIV